VVASLHHDGVNLQPPAAATPAQRERIGEIVEESVASGTRTALLFAMVVVIIGALVSLLIPRIRVTDPPDEDVTLEEIESLGPVSAQTVEPTATEWRG
jgi:hypothetical protein